MMKSCRYLPRSGQQRGVYGAVVGDPRGAARHQALEERGTVVAGDGDDAAVGKHGELRLRHRGDHAKRQAGKEVATGRLLGKEDAPGYKRAEIGAQ